MRPRFKRPSATLTSLALILAFASSLALCIGPSSMPPWELWGRVAHAMGPGANLDRQAVIVLLIRAPRVLMAVVAGAGLSFAGCVMQGVFRNPLASPYVLGVASAAGFGASLAIVLGLSLYGGRFSVASTAFAFALASLAIVYGLSLLKGADATTLILAGIAVSALFSSLTSLMMYVAGESLRALVFWIMGGLWTARWDHLALTLPLLALPLAYSLRSSWSLNALMFGEEKAASLGVNVKRLKAGLLTAATLTTAGVVSVTGTIGFVGLVAPHIARMLVGPDHRFSLIGSCLTGGLLLLAADTVARSLISPAELPVGVLTSMVGVPFFIYLLAKRRVPRL